jgi:hypothetical protein
MVERFLAILLALAAIGVLAGAILIDSGSAGQGGRYYVAVAALVLT